MHRQTFRSGAWRLAVAAVLCLFVGLLLPALVLLTGEHAFGLGITVLVPVVMLPLACLCVYYGLIRRLRIDLDPTGVTVTRGANRFTLPWPAIRKIGVLPQGTQGQPVAVLVIWPTKTPNTPQPPVVFDQPLAAYKVAQLAHLATTENALAAAVEQMSPGKWGINP